MSLYKKQTSALVNYIFKKAPSKKKNNSCPTGSKGIYDILTLIDNFNHSLCYVFIFFIRIQKQNNIISFIKIIHVVHLIPGVTEPRTASTQESKPGG